MNKYDKQMGESVRTMITALAQYCNAYKGEFESPVGSDYVIGEDGVQVILQGLNTLLNGPLGAQDGGELSKMLHTIAKTHEIADENGEF